MLWVDGIGCTQGVTSEVLSVLDRMFAHQRKPKPHVRHTEFGWQCKTERSAAAYGVTPAGAYALWAMLNRHG